MSKLEYPVQHSREECIMRGIMPVYPVSIPMHPIRCFPKGSEWCYIIDPRCETAGPETQPVVKA